MGDNMPVASAGQAIREDTGSIIIVIATDAPLLPHQTKRLARRATMGLARTGSTSGNGSGDIFIAFSTAYATLFRHTRLYEHQQPACPPCHARDSR